VVQALRLNTLSKLTFADSKRFDALVRDVFLGVPFREVEYEDLETIYIVKMVCCINKLVCMNFVMTDAGNGRARGGGGPLRFSKNDGSEAVYIV